MHLLIQHAPIHSRA